MRWLKSRGKAAAVLGLGGLLVTGLGLADSAQAAGSHNIMVRNGKMWSVGSVIIFIDPGRGQSGPQSRCTRIQRDSYSSTDFQVAEGAQLGAYIYSDATCQHEITHLVGIEVPRNLSTSNWWYTVS